MATKGRPKSVSRRGARAAAGAARTAAGGVPRRPLLRWDRALQLYRDHLLARNLRPSTIESYAKMLARFRRFLEARDGAAGAGLTPAAVTLGVLREYQVGLLTGTATVKGRRLGAETVGRDTTVLSGFFAYLAAEELIGADPALRLEQPKSPTRPAGVVLTVAEVRRLLAAADPTTPLGLRDRAVIEVLYGTGLRRTELLSLDLADLDHDRREVLVRDGKGGKGRIVPITRSAYGRLRDYLERARPVLLREGRFAGTAVFVACHGRGMGDMALRKTLARLAARAKITKRLTPHTLRRSFATHLLAAGASLRHIQLLLGHASLATTQVYLSLDARALRRELVLRHPRERLEI